MATTVVRAPRSTPAGTRDTGETVGTFDLGAFITEKTGWTPPKAEDAKWMQVPLWDESFRFQADPSFLALLSLTSNDTGDLVSAFLDLVHPEDRKSFQRFVVQLQTFGGDQFIAMLQGLIEMVTEGKALGQSNGSSRTTRPKAVSKRSVAS